MPRVRLTPGRLTAIWCVLRSLHRLGGSAGPNELLAYASRSALRVGALPIPDGIRLGLEARVVRERIGMYELTDLGRAALGFGVEDEPPPEARRFFLSILLLTDPPAWTAYWQGDPASLDLVIPDSERQLLREAGLAANRSLDEDVSSWVFWEALRRVPLVSETGTQRKIIGDAGEELSLAFERARLMSDGYPELAASVQWLSRESDAYGFDILSFAGGANRPNDRIAIEVKSSSLPRAGAFHFYLSSHEWETAERMADRYRVHIWTSVNPGPPPRAGEEGPVIVEPQSLIGHLPVTPPCRDRCQWQSTEIYLPIAG